MSRTPLLDVRDLSVAYNGRAATHDVSFSVLPGQVTAIVGESGSGKTTSAHAVLGLLPDNAEVIGGVNRGPRWSSHGSTTPNGGASAAATSA